ncbi:hypothetical protein JF66_01075 [Cryobacterium sp. MLB-32]|nr:hypothetical protein JF66_01075 [Cryobacterium sp. MLB-32]
MTAAPGPDYASHLATFGSRPSAPGAARSGAALLDELRASGLEGRGGAAFPAWRKMAAIPGAERFRLRSIVVVGNAAEGEPLSSKDAVLLRIAPHLVIDGLLTVAAAVGATRIFLYGPTASLIHAQRAVTERTDAGAIELRAAADTFVAGEASAVINALGGGEAVPQDRTVRLTSAGLGNGPTLLHNVETLAHIALVARFGAPWFRAVGTPDDPGTRLVTVNRDVSFRGTAPSSRVLEVAGGTPLEHVLAFAGLATASLSAVLVGGFHGTWVPAVAFATPLSRAGLAPYGGSPGAGILMGLETGHCPITVAGRIASYLADQTAGQCGPCVNGLPAMASLLTRLASGERSDALPAEIARLAAVVTGRGSCHHPDGTARFVLSTLDLFASDVAAHLSGCCPKVHS